MKLLPLPDTISRSKNWFLVLVVGLAAAIFVPLNAYWQSVPAVLASRAFVAKSTGITSLCTGFDVPAGELQILGQYAIHPRGFPFRIQEGGFCALPDSTAAMVTDGIAAALVAIVAALGIIVALSASVRRTNSWIGNL